MRFSNYFGMQGFGNFGTGIGNDDPNEVLNRLDYDIDFNSLYNIFLSRFKWKITEDLKAKYAHNNYIERVLFYQGIVGVIDTELYGPLILPATPQGMNSYGEPVGYILYTFGSSGELGADNNGMGRSKALNDWLMNDKDISIKEAMKFDDGQSVFYRPRSEVAVIRDNQASFIPATIVERFAYKTADMRRSEEVYARGWKNPSVVVVNAKNKNSAKVLAAETKKNKDIIILYETSKAGEIPSNTRRVESLNKGHTATELSAYMSARRTLFNECLEYLGIAISSNIGATQMEVNNGLSFARIQYENARQSRLDGIRQASEMFGVELEFTETDANDQLLMLGNKSAPNLAGEEAQQEAKEQTKPKVDNAKTKD